MLRKPPSSENYLIQLDKVNKTLGICLRPGQKMPVKERITKMLRILGDKNLYHVGLKVMIIQMKSMGAYTRGCGDHTVNHRFTWVNSTKEPKDSITFIITELKRGQLPLVRLPQGQQGQGQPTSTARLQLQQQSKQQQQQQHQRKQLIGKEGQGSSSSTNKPVEVIDLDSESEEEENEDTDEESLSDLSEDDDIVVPVTKTQISKPITPTANIPAKESTVTTVTKPQLSKNLTPTAANAKLVEKESTSADPTAAESETKPPETQTYSTVIKGNVFGRKWRLPSKTIIPTGKSLSCLYRIPDLQKFNEFNKASKVTYGVHPFLGDQFVVVTPEVVPVGDENQKPKVRQLQRQGSRSGSGTRSSKSLEEELPMRQTRRTAEVANNSGTRPTRPRGRPPLSASRSSQPPPVPTIMTRKRALRVTKRDSSSNDDSSSSSSGSSSGSDDSSSSSEDYKPASKLFQRVQVKAPVTAATVARTNVRVTSARQSKQDYKGFKCFSRSSRAQALRKGPAGLVYFNAKEHLSPEDYTDLFENWDKFVRNESTVSSYYKTMFIRSDTINLIIYHVSKNEESKFNVDRSVELSNDGSIKITLEGTEITKEFHPYLNIQTTNELSNLLQNLINAKICTGVQGFETVSILPSGVYRDGVWFSGKCTKVRFGSTTDFFANLTTSCTFCSEFRKLLQIEKAEIEKLNCRRFDKNSSSNNNSNKRNRWNRPIVMTSLEEETPTKIELRKGLTDLFYDFWKDLGLADNTPKFDEEEEDEKKLLIEEPIPEPEEMSKLLLSQLPPPPPLPIMNIVEEMSTNLNPIILNTEEEMDQRENDVENMSGVVQIHPPSSSSYFSFPDNELQIMDLAPGEMMQFINSSSTDQILTSVDQISSDHSNNISSNNNPIMFPTFNLGDQL